MKPVVIRHSKNKLIIAVIVLLVIITLVYSIFIESSDVVFKNPVFISLNALVLFGILFYVIREIVIRKAVITISEEGIELRQKGWNHWDYISSYSTYELPDGDGVFLVVTLKDRKILQKNISGLDKTRQEIVQLIKLFKPELLYLGHTN